MNRTVRASFSRCVFELLDVAPVTRRRRFHLEDLYLLRDVRRVISTALALVGSFVSAVLFVIAGAYAVRGGETSEPAATVFRSYGRAEVLRRDVPSTGPL